MCVQERFRGHVQPSCVPYAHAVVAAAADDLLVAIFEDFLGLPSLPSLPPVYSFASCLPAFSTPVGSSASDAKSCTLSGSFNASKVAEAGLTSRDVIDVYIATHDRHNGMENSRRRRPFSSLAESFRFSTDAVREIPEDALFESISLLQKQRVVQLASLSEASAQGQADRQRLIGVLQKRLWGDLLNESVYLKKVKPPVEVLKAGQRSRESKENREPKRQQQNTQDSHRLRGGLISRRRGGRGRAGD